MSENSLNLDALLKQIPVGDIASQLGVDQGTALDAVNKALPGILGGLATNAQSKDGENALEEALAEHNRDIPGLGDVDVNDGEKILSHAFGGKQKEVINAVSGGDNDMFAKLMPMLAPMVMAFLAKNFLGNRGASQSSGGGVGDLLGSILGGGGSGGPLGDLGSILGGGSNKGGGLGSILGSILGR